MSAHAPEIDRVLWLVHALMFLLFAGWGSYFLWALVRFRARRQPQAVPSGAKGRIAFATEVGVVLAEGALLVGIALPLWFQRTATRPESHEAIAVRVVAEVMRET